MIAVIDYGTGNVRSVVKMMEHIGCKVELTNDVKKIKKASRIVMPGVGAFKPAMDQLSQFDLINVLQEEVITNKKPFLGICLGMQLLSDRSSENGMNNGLGWISGDVRLLNPTKTVKVPQFGWFSTRISELHPVTINLPSHPFFYFAHSYHFVPKNKKHISMTMNYGESYVAAIAHENIFATQFHPEKSQDVGIKFFENFINWNH